MKNLYSDGHATLSFIEDVGLEDTQGGKYFGLALSDSGGFTILVIPPLEWENIKQKITSALTLRA